MTSWIRVPPTKQIEIQKTYFLETTEEGYCNNFVQYLYAHLFSLSERRPLEVYDRTNAISANYPLIHNTFVDVSGVSYLDAMSPRASSIQKNMRRVLEYVNRIPAADLRLIAQQVFQWNESLVEKLEPIIKEASLPKSFDVGVHIRSNDVNVGRDLRSTVTVDQYVQAVRTVQKKAGKEKMSVFVMTDNAQRLGEFIQKADRSWKVYTLSNPTLSGITGRNPASTRLTAYTYFMAELLVMQSIDDIVCRLSNNVGKFLYLTVEHPERIFSLDASRFSVIS